MKIGSTWLDMLLAAAVAALLQLAAGPAAAAGVAVVTDVSGRVTMQGPVRILSELAADARVEIAPGAELVVIYLPSGTEYAVKGPALVQFRAAAPHSLRGAAPQARPNPLGTGDDVRIRPQDVSQGVLVMRRGGRPGARIRLINPVDARTLELAPEFRWREPEPGLQYRFELTDQSGKALYETELAGTSLKLPAVLRLQEGASYMWEISARLADGRRYASTGEFRVAASPLRSQAAALRPAAGAPVSARVAYAAWLEQAELRDEAHKYWSALAAERPGDTNLKALAEQ